MLSELPGVGTLDGTAWGGVTRDNLVIRYDYLHRLYEVPLLTQLSVIHRALQGYMINGNQNGYQMPNLTNIIDGQGALGNFYFENGIQTPGLTTIPICTIDVVSDNWKNYGGKNTKPDGYPCN